MSEREREREGERERERAAPTQADLLSAFATVINREINSGRF